METEDNFGVLSENDWKLWMTPKTQVIKVETLCKVQHLLMPTCSPVTHYKTFHFLLLKYVEQIALWESPIQHII